MAISAIALTNQIVGLNKNRILHIEDPIFISIFQHIYLTQPCFLIYFES